MPSPFISSKHTCNLTACELKCGFYPKEMELHLVPTKHCSPPPRKFSCMKNHPMSWNSLWARVTSLVSAVLNIISIIQIVALLHLLPRSVCLAAFTGFIEINCRFRVLVPFVTKDSQEM